MAESGNRATALQPEPKLRPRGCSGGGKSYGGDSNSRFPKASARSHNSKAGTLGPGRHCQGHSIPQPRMPGSPGSSVKRETHRWKLPTPQLKSAVLPPFEVWFPPPKDVLSLPAVVALPVKRLHSALMPTYK